MSSPNRVRITIWLLFGLGLALSFSRFSSPARGPRFEAALFLAILMVLVLPLILWFRYLKRELLFESAVFALMAGVSSFSEWLHGNPWWGVAFAVCALLFLVKLGRAVVLLSKRDNAEPWFRWPPPGRRPN